MRERPPPEFHEGQRIECEFVIPIDSRCLKLRMHHDWEEEDERVSVCKVCDAEWWSNEERETAMDRVTPEMLAAWIAYAPPETAGAVTHRAVSLQRHAFFSGWLAAKAPATRSGEKERG